MSNCDSQDANFQITHFTDSIGEDIQNTFIWLSIKTVDTNYFMAHLGNAIQKPNSDYFSLNTEYTYAVTTWVKIPTYKEALHSHINPLVINNMYIPTYDISICSIYQHIYKYKTN